LQPAATLAAVDRASLVTNRRYGVATPLSVILKVKLSKRASAAYATTGSRAATTSVCSGFITVILAFS
jgi:hypothetical protein